MSTFALIQPDETVPLKASQIDRATDILCTAFHDAVWAKFAFPDSSKRAQALRLIFRSQAKFCLRYGYAYTTPEVNAVACWIASENARYTFWRKLRTGMLFVPRRLGRESRHRFSEITNTFNQVRQRLMKGPYWYLVMLGVDPACKGQGLGSKVHNKVLRLADEAGALCYFETYSERHVEYYKKFGFEVLETGDQPIKFWVMTKLPSQR